MASAPSHCVFLHDPPTPVILSPQSAPRVLPGTSCARRPRLAALADGNWTKHPFALPLALLFVSPVGQNLPSGAQAGVSRALPDTQNTMIFSITSRIAASTQRRRRKIKEQTSGQVASWKKGKWSKDQRMKLRSGGVCLTSSVK